VFVLVGIANSSLGEAMTIGCTATLVQCLWRTHSKRSSREAVFSVAAVAIAILVAYNPAHSFLSRELGWATWMLVLAIATFLLVSSGLAALTIVCDRLWDWKTGLLVVPFLYLTFSVYRLRWDRRGVTAIPIGAYRSTSRPYSRKSVPGPPGL
jgi:hypothetical protein